MCSYTHTYTVEVVGVGGKTAGEKQKEKGLDFICAT